ncbi:MAG: deoxyribodipyrimidine photo-lyase [Pseudomonadota bacterium]
MTTTIVWFRQDLRINDNPALFAAAKAGTIVPVYIYDDTLDSALQPGGASKWWLHHALHDLAEKFEQRLIVTTGDPVEVLKELTHQFDASHLVWNRMYEHWAIERDSSIKRVLAESGVTVKSFNGSLLWEPMDILKKDGTPYKVYTPFYRKGCLNAEHPRPPLAPPKVDVSEQVPSNAQQDIAVLNLLPTIRWDIDIEQEWTVTADAAQEALSAFIQKAIEKYSNERNLPAVKGTSRLSPYLHFGMISPNQVWYAVHDAFDGDVSSAGVDTFLSEIGWREFSYYLLFHFDDLRTQNFNSKFDEFPWHEPNEQLIAWQKGQTGIPIVDAGMRELYQTGYMHNRVRMIVGSFLVKNLLIDWREGERWFWDCLLDADSASNAASWQWVAGSGADASPYFRIFNPILQGEKFDKQGTYVKKYCPELAAIPAKYIHKPWEMPSMLLDDVGIILGKDYPQPIVDLKQSRQRALDAFASLKESA